MCSTGERLARIGLAIDQLAADTRAAAGQQGRLPAEGDESAGGVSPSAAVADHPAGAAAPAGRLAELWAMLAELDPELARRLPGYLG
jgi:hypothetical protein